MKEEENKHSSPKYYPQTKFRGIFKEWWNILFVCLFLQRTDWSACSDFVPADLLSQM